MKFPRSYAAVPNRLIDDTAMHYSTKRVYQALALLENRHGQIRISLSRLAEKASVCPETAQQAVAELETHGFLRKKRSLRWSARHAGLVYAANTYKLRKDFSAGYTLIPAAAMQFKTTHAGFCVLLFLYRCAGREGRAYPSIRYIAGAWREKTGKGLEVSVSTVQRVLRQLASCKAMIKIVCEKRTGSLSCNSYLMTATVGSRVFGKMPQIRMENFFSCGGVPIFPGAFLSNKITEVCIGEESIYGDFQFGELTKSERLWLAEMGAGNAPMAVPV